MLVLFYEDFKKFQGYFYDETIAEPIEIANFEYEEKYIQDQVEPKTAFLSFSKERRGIVNGREVASWPEGNQVVERQLANLSLVITEQPIKNLGDKLPQFIVPDIWEFMLSLSTSLCSSRRGKIIATTGSVGKSSTRLMLDHILNQDTVLSNRGNHNTRFAIPLYLTKLASDPSVVNLEVSLNALNNRYPGPLTTIIQPDIAILTSVGEAHMATFSSLTHLAEYKARIFKGLKKDGTAILNADLSEEVYEIALNQAKKQTTKIKTYSMHSTEADLFLVSFQELKYTTEVTINYNKRHYTYYLGTASQGMIENSMAVLLAAVELGYKIEDCLLRFADFKSLPKVMEISNHFYQQQSLTIIDDTHNASIPAMINAINSFKRKSQYYSGKKVLVLGQVADLGKQGPALHEGLIPVIEAANADLVLGYGVLMKPVIETVSIESCWYEQLPELLEGILSEITDQSLFLLKGSISHSDFYRISSLLKNRLKRTSMPMLTISNEEGRR